MPEGLYRYDLRGPDYDPGQPILVEKTVIVNHAAFRQTKAEKEKELAVVQEELQQKKQIAGNTEVLLTADNLQQYVKKIEVDHKKNTYTEFVF